MTCKRPRIWALAAFILWIGCCAGTFQVFYGERALTMARRASAESFWWQLQRQLVLVGSHTDRLGHPISGGLWGLNRRLQRLECGGFARQQAWDMYADLAGHFPGPGGSWKLAVTAGAPSAGPIGRAIAQLRQAEKGPVFKRRRASHGNR